MGKPAFYPTFCPWSNPVFPSGKSPYRAYMSLWGIQPGVLWDKDIDPAPPSHTWTLYQIDEFSWFTQSDDFLLDFWYVNDGVQEQIVVNFLGGPGPFSYLGPSSHFDGANSIVDPAGMYYGGFASIDFINPSIPSSIQDVMISLGVAIDSNTKFEGIPTENGKTVYRFANKIKSDCIKVLMNKPFFP
jgi:hypothetical protein